MRKNFSIADSFEMNKREKIAKEFYYLILDPEKQPILVTDEATLYDIYAGNKREIIMKILENYGVLVSEKEFRLHFWKLLDILIENKKNRERQQ